jgi:glyoxylase-like metal-dependent hydrolase (beta-lactamase superfamily II)
MVQISSLPVSYVVNTHVHDDHWLGNGYYKEIGATIIGSSAFKTLAKVDQTRMQRRISQEAYQGTKQVFPTVFVSDTKILNFNGKKVYIIAVNHKAHTDSDLLVYIPSQKLLFAGDLVFNERLPSIRDGDISGWISALEKIKKMNVDYIVGGHGTLVSRKSVDFTYNYLTSLKKQVAKLLEDGEEIGDVVNKVTMSEYKDIPFYDSMQRQNVEITYRMLEWEDE